MNRQEQEDQKSIVRIQKRVNPFVQIDKAVIEDKTLTWRAKGLLVYLLSKPDNWQIRMSDIVKHGVEGRDSVRAAMAELRDSGYAKLINTRNGAQWIVTEVPEPPPEKPSVEPPPEKPHAAFANAAKSASTNNKEDSTNKDLSNNERGKTLCELFSEPEKPDDGIPKELDTPEFREAFNDYIEMRKELKLSKLKPRSLRLKFAEWKQWGVAKTVQALRDSVKNQYQGVFEPKTNGHVNGFANGRDMAPKKPILFGWTEPDDNGNRKRILHGKVVD